MPATWPAGVPYNLLRQGAALKDPELTIRSQTDSGLARQRRVFTAAPEGFTGTLRMTQAQLIDFKAWRKDLAGGTFTWPAHPFSGGAVEARFVTGEQGNPSPDPQTSKWLVPVSIELVE